MVGGPSDTGLVGAVWVYTRHESDWDQQGSKLVGTGAIGSSFQGISVALSADGNTLMIGGDSDNGYVGAAWVYSRSRGEWTQHGPKLIGATAGGSYQGVSVALSGDGHTAIIGAYADNAGAGAARVYVRTHDDAWTQQGSNLIGTDAQGSVRQGYSVALSADGNTAVVGAPLDGGLSGAAWVYTRKNGAWAQRGSKLVGTGAAGHAFQGLSVAMSADGKTALVGADYDDGGVGAAWVYTRGGHGVWTQQGSKLLGTGAIGTSAQGVSVALSADGNTAIVGGRDDNGSDNRGAAWVFTRNKGVWGQQGSKLVGTGTVGSSLQGRSVALSADGNTALVGGVADDGYVGAVWVYTRSRDGVWTQQGSKLVGTDAVGTSYQGVSVALSADGNTAIVGGYLDNSGAGAAWVYTRSPNGEWTQQGSKLVGTGEHGYSVALSADGNIAIVGAPTDNGDGGAARLYARSPDGIWAQQGSKLVGTGAIGHEIEQGYSVALSGDGNTAVIGGPFDNGNLGAMWVFSLGAPPVQEPQRLHQQ